MLLFRPIGVGFSRIPHGTLLMFSIVVLLLQQSQLTLSMEEGDSCVMNGVYGVCATACKVLETGFKSGQIKRKDFVHCGYTRFEEIICCPVYLRTSEEAEGASSTTMSPAPSSTTVAPSTTTERIVRSNAERPSISACKRIESKLDYELSPHILEGIPVERGEFPHAALIQYSEENVICGGSLIEQRFVLTAAHCVINARRQPIGVRLGMVNVANTQEGEEFGIKAVHIHPDYNGKLKYNDIALLELDRDAFNWDTVNFEFIGPACLYTNQTDPPPSKPLIAIGWGLTNVTTRTQSKRLLKVELKLHDTEDCDKQYKVMEQTSLPQGVISTQMCAYSDGKDACAGDSGGPLNVGENIDMKYYQIVGIVSTGFSCGTSTPGLYTKVPAFLDYVESIVWPVHL